MKKVLTFFTAIMFAVTGFAQVSLSSLLREMTDRDVPARFPSPAYTCAQASSYNRATVAKDQPGWFANWDRTVFVRTEKNAGRREFVMMDEAGPGAIVRFWMTFAGENSGKGIMRIYVDDMETPAVEGAAFDILSGGKLCGPPLAASVSELTPYERRGHNLYLPIPYAKRCKVTYQSDNIREDDFGIAQHSEKVYYNINYRTYPAGTKVVSFTQAELKKNAALIAATQKALQTPTAPLVSNTMKLDAELAPNTSKTFTIKGTGAIRRIVMEVLAAHREQALRSLVIKISFDGTQTVWTPAGDFFGIGYRPIAADNWYTSAVKDGAMECRWVMPFREGCEITLYNYGTQPVSVKNASAGWSKWSWDARSMHFGSSWHQYTRIDTGDQKTPDGDTGGAQDLNFVTLQGKGVYMGDGIALFNTTYAWWGEGDEKIWVDGESFPSHVGTGTEDYYGYAWCRPEVFIGHPFIAQPQGDGSFDPGYSVNTRYRALDAIPFHSSLVVDMELWHWRKATINYAPVSYWYVIPGGRSLISEDVAGVKEKVALHRRDIVSADLVLSVEGENLYVQGELPGRINHFTGLKETASGGMIMQWNLAPVGSSLTLCMESAFEGQFQLSGVFVREANYGTVNVSFNDRSCVKNLNLNAPQAAFERIDLGVVTLKKGVNTIKIEMVGKADDFRFGFMGLDKLEFVKKQKYEISMKKNSTDENTTTD